MSTSVRLGRRRPGIRLRFTALYVALFALSGVGLLGITVLLSVDREATRPVHPGQTTPDAAQRRIAALQAQLSQAHAEQTRQLLTGAAIALVVMLLVSVVLGRAVAGRVLRPLRTITAATRHITADNLHERLAVGGPHDEVRQLADTIDALLERLEAALAAQRLFAANASHELRTPLATMRAALDVAMAKPPPIPESTTVLAQRLRTELDQIDHLIDGLLMLARTRYGAPADPVTMPLARPVSAALEARSAEIAARELTVRADLDGGVTVRGSRSLLVHMIDNVVDNAVTHNDDGGCIQVSVAADGPSALLVVETGGQRLEREQVRRLAQPFHRLGAERTGTAHGSGLGLSIVSAIAAAHGGALELTARAEGGLRVVITLPRTTGVPA